MQTGAYDCGVFAIAYATDIAYSLDPASSLFRQGRMIGIVISPFTRLYLFIFPSPAVFVLFVISPIGISPLHGFIYFYLQFKSQNYIPSRKKKKKGRMISVFECWQIDTISMEGNFNYTDLWDGEKG